MEFMKATKNDIPALKQLWQEIFKDDDGYIDLFFEYKMKPEYTFVAKENNEIAGAVYSVYAPLVLDDGTEVSALYMCGICTKAEYRGRKIASTLIEECFEFAKSENIDVCYLIPANIGLFDFYEKSGFEKVSYINKVEMLGEPCKLPDFEIGFDKLLVKQYSKYDMPFKPLRTEAEFMYIDRCYSAVLRFDNGYIVLDEDEKAVYLMEQTFDGTKYAKNFAHDKGKKLIVFEPADTTGTPFAVAKKINSEIKLPGWGYINLMLN